MAIIFPSPSLARMTLGRLAPVFADAANEAERADRSRRLVRLLVLQAAAIRTIALNGWPNPGPEDGDLLVAARDIAAMHAELPVEWIGSVHEQALGEHAAGESRAARSGSRRKRTGAFYTPPDLVAHLLDQALEPVIDERLRVCADPVAAITSIRVLDPSCGGGNFLLAAARRLAARLVHHSACSMPESMSLVVRSCIHGVDRDSVAVEACIGSLMLEAASPSLSRQAVAANILHGDSLTGTLAGTDLSVTPRGSSRRRVANGATPSPAPFDRDAWCRAFLGRHGDEESDVAPLHWPEAFPGVFTPGDANAGFDVVVGNPPFLNQLERATTLSRARDALIRAVSGGVGGSYTDVSATFLWRSVQLAAPGGRVAMVQPQSLLASRDAGPVREAIAGRAAMVSIWVAEEHLFEGASVYTCAPVLRVGGQGPGMVSRHRGRAFDSLPAVHVDAADWSEGDTWTPIAAAAWGVPEFSLARGGTIDDIALATADFRDQYYGLDGFLVEDGDVSPDDTASHPRLVTTGLIDLARVRWGERPVRMLRRAWQAPRVDRVRMEREGTLGPWLERRLVPKVLLATQTRVLEAWVDGAGDAVPCIPLLTITPRPGVDLWRLAAAVASPVACAVAMQRHAGTALTVDAIKLSASQVLRLPLPACPHGWERAAAMFKAASLASSDGERRSSLAAFGREMSGAYGLEPEARERVAAWWASRWACSERTGRGSRKDRS
ncbi:MAG: hypothetical protein RL689_1939 [Planctomycetota bacterium]